MTIVIIGASVRAAAQSARRAGFAVHAIDLFADRDLRAIATCQRLPFDEYPEGFLRLLKEAPPGPLMYTGGLENYPDLIDEIAQSRPIIGNSGESLRKARDPYFIRDLLRRNGLPALDVALKQPTEGDWLWKPIKGSAGMGIGRHPSADADGYYQRFSEGEPHSALYFARDGRSEHLASFRQLIGTSWLHAPEFRYAGNIGPIVLPEATDAILAGWGAAIAGECQLQGPFGIDFLLHEDQPWLCEVNPRYTASVELFERATDQSALMGTAKPTPHRCIAGKAVLYAPTRMAFPDMAIDATFADIPETGEIIEAGMPICTRFVESARVAEVESILARRASEVFDFLARASG